MKLTFDGKIALSTGRSRKELHWKNKEILWSEFVSMVSDTNRTHETYQDYIKMPKSRQDEIKDVGGFVGGTLIGGKRKHDSVLNRSMMALDIDFGTTSIWDTYCMLYGNAGLIYSTHKHTAEKPRLRLILPLAREVSREEYEPLCRKFADDLGIQFFDDTTFEASRLMYWPSTSKNGDYYFDYCDGEWINPDDILKTYRDWRDSSFWPQSDRVANIIKRNIKKQGDPLEKPGLIGAFCRTYDMQSAIETFLSEEYESCANGRYTYLRGSTTAGLVIYQDKFAYSHHGTDPTSGKLCNAFDLVRIHKFGLLDEDTKEGTAPNRLPSFTAMTDFCAKDKKTRRTLGGEKIAEAGEDFAELEEDLSWHEELDIDSKGAIRTTINNIVLILQNDNKLKGKLALNEFEYREVTLGDLPWRKYHELERYITDKDDSNLRHYLEHKYGVTGQNKILDAVNIIFDKNRFHPIKQYLRTCKWDNKKRLDTLFIDYLGVKDSPYARMVTRKAFTAAIARIRCPGCKFDYVLTLIGKQGIGKSSILKKLGGSWFSDSLDTVVGKDAYELIQGVWLVEMGELAGLKKAEVDQIKHFISKQEDRYRVAYGKRTENHPRQCIFFGTTNNKDFLKDATGNRRFWPLDCGEIEPTKNLFRDLDEHEREQIWAEAIHYFEKGETLYLPKEVEEKAKIVQEEHSEESSKIGIVEEYLNTPVPKNWYDLDLYERKSYLRREKDPLIKEEKQELFLRDKICVPEIFMECFDGTKKDLTNWVAKEYHNLMRKMEGWEEHKSEDKGRLRFTIYGKQKAYLRKK